MPILPSRRSEIEALLARLAAPDAAGRDAAVARLRLLGARALGPLRSWLPGASPAARGEALRVLEGSEEPRALELLLAVGREATGELARRVAETAASFPRAGVVAGLRALLRSPAPEARRAAARSLAGLQAAGLVEALDPLLELLWDRAAEPELRAVAREAVQALPERERRPLLARLRTADGPAPPALAADEPPEATARRARELAATGRAAAIPALHEALARLAAHRDGPHDEARAVVHEALARLDSRIALYDLREMLAARPVRGLEALLAAARAVGDGSVARLLVRLVAERPTLGTACAPAFAAIVRREPLRRGSRALRDLTPAERRALDALWPPAARRRAAQ